MATWHQLRRPVKLWHATKWTIVSDPPHDGRTVSRFDTREEAYATKERWEKAGQTHLHILPPESL